MLAKELPEVLDALVAKAKEVDTGAIKLILERTAPPVDGQANAHLREFLADLFGVAKSQVTLLADETSRDKWFRIAAPKRLPPGIKPFGAG